LNAEKNALGYYITGHPLENYLDILTELNACKIEKITFYEKNSKLSIGGIVTDLQIRATKKGAKFALVCLEDESSSVKCVLWPEIFSKYESILKNDVAVLMTGRCEVADEGSPTVIIEECAGLDDILQRKARSVVIRMPAGSVNSFQLETIFGVLDQHRGDCEVVFEMELEGSVSVRAKPHGALRIKGSLELEFALQSQGCKVEWVNVFLAR
jgi:DNA polymerase-3 subunit alpha